MHLHVCPVNKESQCPYCVKKLKQLSQADSSRPTKFEHQMEKSKSDLFNFPLSAGRYNINCFMRKCTCMHVYSHTYVCILLRTYATVYVPTYIVKKSFKLSFNLN